MQRFTVLLCAFAAILVYTEAIVFTRCGLVRELRKQKFPESQLRNWVCLVENESRRDTSFVGPLLSGSQGFGLFQIHSKFWCSTTSTPGKECNVTCKQLITNDITIASDCAKKVYQRHGFSAWYGWKNNCQVTLPVISNC